MTYPDPDQSKVRELLAKLETWWWSPCHPSDYVKVGDLGHKTKALVNLLWILKGRPLSTIPATDETTLLIQSLRKLVNSKELVDGYPVYEWATLLCPKDFFERVVKPWRVPELAQVALYSEWRETF